MTLLRRLSILTGGLCLVLMALITAADIGMRLLVNRPVFGASEYVQYLLAVAVFSGMTAVTADRGHVSVSILEPLLLKRAPRFYHIAYSLFTIAGTSVVTAILVWRATELLEFPEESVVLGLPLEWVVWTMSILSASSIAAALMVLLSKPAPTSQASMPTEQDVRWNWH